MTATSTICRCNLCSAEIEFEPFRAGETITCPVCAMETELYVPGGHNPKPALPRTLEPQPIYGKRIKSRHRFGWFSILEIIGWLTFGPSVLIFIAGIVTATSNTDPSSGAAIGALFLIAIPMVFGAALLTIARHISAYWLCSLCRNKLTNKEALQCHVCHAQLS